jgi:chaperonin cofactor prefoldin
MEEEIQYIESNNINIEFLQKQVSKLQTDVEELKDKVRNNGSH